MGRARLTLSMALLMSVSTGCYTESEPQRQTDMNPLTSGNTGGVDGLGGGQTIATGGTDTSATAGGATGGTTGVGMADDSDAGMDMDMACVKGMTKGSSVLLIGDSYVDINGKAFGTELQRLAKAAGSLGASDKYTDRSISGTQMVGGLLGTPIPGQYDAEKNSDGHVKTVIMDGGGNDVLLGNRGCITTQAPPASKSCVDTINNAMNAAKTLLAKMAADGVENVVYFFYPHLPGGGLGGDKTITNQTVDYAVPLVKQVCESAPVNCVFLDTRGLFGDAPGDFQDGIHPTVPNIQKISQAAWKLMQQECIAQ